MNLQWARRRRTPRLGRFVHLVALDRVPGGFERWIGCGGRTGYRGTFSWFRHRRVLSGQPASFCGISGVTPTYGRVSRYGLTAFASSLDHIGPFGHSVRDTATLLKVIAGRDPMDATSSSAPVPNYSSALDGKVRGMKIGMPKEFFDGAGERPTATPVSGGHRGIEEARL